MYNEMLKELKNVVAEINTYDEFMYDESCDFIAACIEDREREIFDDVPFPQKDRTTRAENRKLRRRRIRSRKGKYASLMGMECPKAGKLAKGKEIEHRSRAYKWLRDGESMNQYRTNCATKEALRDFYEIGREPKDAWQYEFPIEESPTERELWERIEVLEIEEYAKILNLKNWEEGWKLISYFEEKQWAAPCREVANVYDYGVFLVKRRFKKESDDFEQEREQMYQSIEDIYSRPATAIRLAADFGNRIAYYNNAGMESFAALYEEGVEALAAAVAHG